MDNFQITETDPNGQFVQAKPRDEYFPIYFIEPLENNRNILGFNISSAPAVLDALIKAGKTGKQVATARLKFVENEKDDCVFLILQPVYNKDTPADSEEARLGNLQGFIVGIFHLGEVLESAIKPLGTQGIDLFLYDISAPTEERFLYGRKPGLTKGQISLGQTQDQIRKSLYYKETIDIATRRWLVLCGPVPGYFEVRKSFRPWLILSVGLFMTLILTGYFVSGIKRTELVESEVQERTAELQKEVAERKRAELALRLSEQCFRAIADYTYFWEIWVSPTGRPLWTNPAVMRITGYTIKEFLELKDYPISLVYQQDKEKVAKAFKAALRGKSGKELEFRLRKKDGSIIWADMTWQPIYDENGVSQGHRTSIRDITERKRAEEALRNSEERYRQLFDTMLDGFALHEIICDEQGKPCDYRYLNVNPAFEEMTGITRENILGKTVLEVLPQTESYWIETFGNVALTGESVRFENYAKEINKYFSVFAYSPSRKQFAVIFEDITDRKTAEEQLKKERDKAQQYLDIAAVMLVVIDKSQNTLLINKKGCEVLGRNEDDIVGKNWFDNFLPERLRESVREAFCKLLEGHLEPVEYYENPIINNHGQERIIAWHNTVLRDEYGNITGTLSSGEDITEKKLAAEEREKLLKTLDAKNKELESILFVASHDLRSPLVNIQGFSHELDRSCEQIRSVLEQGSILENVPNDFRTSVYESIPESLHFILTSVNKMDSLLSGLLKLSRLGNKAITLETLDMNEIMADIIGNMEYQIKESGATVEVKHLPSSIGDSSQIHQIFTNLLGNALKYLDESKQGLIIISGWQQEQYSVYCVGLTIVRRIIDRHNGKVWVESEPGRGSKFFVALPWI
jgi:PAS domain S-box-containing protein